MTKLPGRIIRGKKKDLFLFIVSEGSGQGCLVSCTVQSIVVGGECEETGFSLLSGLEVKRSSNAGREQGMI